MAWCDVVEPRTLREFYHDPGFLGFDQMLSPSASMVMMKGIIGALDLGIDVHENQNRVPRALHAQSRSRTRIAVLASHLGSLCGQA